jgi:hypothetical protein
VWSADACRAVGNPLRNFPVSQRPQGVQGSGPGEAACLTSEIDCESEVPEDLAIHWLANAVRPPPS